MRGRVALAVLLALRCAAAAEPDDAAPPVAASEQVVVHATAPKSDDPAAFATVVRPPAGTTAAEDVAGLLRAVPGARVAAFGGIGRYATIALRGSTPEQVTVLVDGVPQNRALGAAVDLSALSAADVERIVVYRGFPPAASGVTGFGGLVDVHTRRAGSGPAAEVTLAGGSLGTRGATLDWSTPLPRGGALRVGATLLDAANDFTYRDTRGTWSNAADDVTRRRTNDDVKSRGVRAAAAWETGAGGRLTLDLRARRRESGLPGVDSLPTPSARLDEGGAALALGFTRPLAHAAAIELAFDGAAEEARLDDRCGLRTRDQVTRSVSYGAAALVRASAGRHAWLVRADARFDRAAVRDRALELVDRGGARRTSFALALEDQWRAGRVTLAPSVRYESLDDRFLAGAAGTVPPPAADARRGALTGKLGVAVDAGAGFLLRASAGSFSRAPNLTELFGDRGSVVGNPRLVPERGTKYEFGAAWALARGAWRLDAEAAAFENRTRDLILFVPNAQGTAVARNLDAALVRGVELSLALTAPHGFAIDGAASLTRAVDDAQGVLHGKPLPGRPWSAAHLGASWTGRRWSCGWELHYVGPNASDAADTPALRLPARVLHDVRAGLRLPAGFTLGVSVMNIFDRAVRDVARFPLPGRVALLRAGWQWRGTGR